MQGEHEQIFSLHPLIPVLYYRKTFQKGRICTVDETSAFRRLCRRIRQDGLTWIPGSIRFRLRVRRGKPYAQLEARARQAEEDRYQRFIRRHEQPLRTPFVATMRLSFLIPTYNTDPVLLHALADSLRRQSCPAWEACLYDGASTREDTRAALQALQAQDARFRVTLGERNLGISGNTNAAFATSTGDFIALCDHDDLLAPDAVRCILQAAQDGADFVYTDEDKVSQDGTHFFEPHLKSDFAIDTLRSGNYICHITATSRALFTRVGGLRPGFDGSQDHDLALRLAEVATKIVHIPRILYHWRMLDASFSHQKAAICADAAARAVDDHMKRLGLNASATVHELRVQMHWQTSPARIVCFLWGDGAAPSLPCPVHRFSDWRQVNELVRQTDCDVLLFLHTQLHPLEKHWLSSLLAYAQRPDVACVGSALLDAEDVFRHAGYAVNVPGGAVSHQFGQWRYGHPYMLTDRLVRNVTGVSSALMMLRRDVFLSVGGFSDYESDLRGADLGLKCLQAGYLNIYTHEAPMQMSSALSQHPPCLVKAAPATDLRTFSAAWGKHPTEHYYSPLFEPDGRMFIRTRE